MNVIEVQLNIKTQSLSTWDIFYVSVNILMNFSERTNSMRLVSCHEFIITGSMVIFPVFCVLVFVTSPPILTKFELFACDFPFDSQRIQNKCI